MAPTDSIRTTVLVGNPKRRSRTGTVGAAVASAVAHRAGWESRLDVLELADLSAELFAWGDPRVAEAKNRVIECDLLVVASPVYKASYTGLLKSFLDQFSRDELAALPTVPVMVGAGDLHSLAVETHLRPVLVELGASMPTRGLFVTEGDLGALEPMLEAFLDLWGGVLTGAITGHRARRVSPERPSSDGTA